jgi:hypothetical protein
LEPTRKLDYFRKLIRGAGQAGDVDRCDGQQRRDDRDHAKHENPLFDGFPRVRE